MNKKIVWLISVAAIVLIFILYRNTDTLDSSSNIDIQIELYQDLADDIQIVSAAGKRPGDFNPVETVITLKNTGDTEKRVLATGKWQDARGGNYGGISSVRTLVPGRLETFQTGTNSRNVSVYKFSLGLTDKTEDELLTESLANKKVQIADGFGMTYTETPTDTIPQWTPRGVANGEPFQAQTIMFRQDHFPDWRLSISDHRFDVLIGAGIERSTQKNLQTIYIDLPHEPTTGGIYEKEMSYGGGIFQIKPSPSAFETTSWNTSIAYYIEITNWDKGPSSGTSCNSMQALIGAASGRLYISFQGSEHGLENSWISGVFEDAPIVYCGKKD